MLHRLDLFTSQFQQPGVSAPGLVRWHQHSRGRQYRQPVYLIARSLYRRVGGPCSDWAYHGQLVDHPGKCSRA